jgi:hypothetical protein
MGGTNTIYFKMIRGVDPADNNEYVVVGIMVNRVVALVPTANIRVVLGFIMDTSQDPPPCAWRFHVKPFIDGAPTQMQKISIPAADVPFWRDPPPSANNTIGWNTPSPAHTVPWLGTLAKAWSYSNAQGMWSMELKLPVNLVDCSGNQSVWFPPPTNSFRFYANVISTPTGGGATYQAPWPSTLPINGPIDKNTPYWSQWNYFSA